MASEAEPREDRRRHRTGADDERGRCRADGARRSRAWTSAAVDAAAARLGEHRRRRRARPPSRADRRRDRSRRARRRRRTCRRRRGAPSSSRRRTRCSSRLRPLRRRHWPSRFARSSSSVRVHDAVDSHCGVEPARCRPSCAAGRCRPRTRLPSSRRRLRARPGVGDVAVAEARRPTSRCALTKPCEVCCTSHVDGTRGVSGRRRCRHGRGAACRAMPACHGARSSRCASRVRRRQIVVSAASTLARRRCLIAGRATCALRSAVPLEEDDDDRR